MSRRRDFALFIRFLGHILTATVLFFCVAGAAVALETFADWIEAHHYSQLLSAGCHGTAYFIFLLDIGALAFFLAIQTLEFLRDTWRSFRGLK